MIEIFSNDSIISEIESPSFLAHIGLSNNLDNYIYFLENSEMIKELINFIRSDISNFNSIFNRIKKLINIEIDINKIHPYDHSIATYLYSLDKSFPTEITSVINFIKKSNKQNLYWTDKMIKYISDNKAEFYESIYNTAQYSSDFDTDDMEKINTDSKASSSNIIKNRKD